MIGVMHFASLTEFLGNPASRDVKGPVAAIIVEDEVEIDTTIRHHAFLGFKTILCLAPAEIAIPDTAAEMVTRIDCATREAGASKTILDHLMKGLPRDTWLYYGYNAEFLFYPFCETRSVGELLTFHTEERRRAMLTYVIDVYAGDLDAHENAVSLEDAHLDRSGYYALGRYDAEGNAAERQLEFYGGLRWRFEEHIEVPRRRIDRIALVRSDPALRFHEDHRWSEEELNTYACPWHHNLTAAIVSFRTAKALRENPASRHEIGSFRWHNSTEFEWHSQQLLDLGLMEPGQWF